MLLNNWRALFGVHSKLLLLMAVLCVASAAVFAQEEQKVTFTLNSDHIVAGEPLLLRYQITGVPDGSSLVFKNREKGWISIRLVDSDGKEVGEIDTDEPIGSPQKAKKTTQTAEAGSPTEKNGVRYVVPQMTRDQRIIVSQTHTLTKAGVYRLIVQMKLLAALQPDGPLPNTPDEAKAREPKAYRPIRAVERFRVVVTDVGSSALAQKAAALRETFITAKGPEVLQAAHDLVSWPSSSALQEWRTLAQDSRCDPLNFQNFAGMLAYEGSSDAVRFLGELTWDMNKLNMRPALRQLYHIGDTTTKKQIAAMYAVHGEALPTY